MVSPIRIFRGGTHSVMRIGVLGVQWQTREGGKSGHWDRQLQFFWRSKQAFTVRFGRHGHRLYSERNQHLPSIQKRWHYFFGKRVTIITPRKETPSD